MKFGKKANRYFFFFWSVILFLSLLSNVDILNDSVIKVRRKLEKNCVERNDII